MRFLSVCSGIEAASCAWDWEAVAFSEIEKFPSQVLSHHYPETPNWGDMTKFKEWPDANVDVLVGGTPCQSFSVAGLRKGLDDPRGNLMLTYLAIAAKYRPKWVVWENVPGVLSSNGGLDFASFLRGLGECGYGFAYRVLDAQYFGVPQRRRRVFVVGCLGDWRSAAAVLFEQHSLQGHPAPRRKKGQSVAGTFTARANSGGWSSDVDLAASNYMQPVAKCLTTSTQRNDAGTETMIPWPAEVCGTLDTSFASKYGQENQHVNAGCPMFVPAFWNGNDIAESLTCTSNNQRMPDKGKLQMVVQPTYSLQGAGVTSQNSQGSGWNEEVSFTLNRMDVHGVAQPIAYNIAPGKGLLKDDIHITNADATKTLDAFGSNPAMHQGGAAIVQPMAVCLGGQHPNAGIGIDQSPTLTEAMGAGGGHIPIMAQPIAVGTDVYNGAITGDVAATMGTPRSSVNASGPTVMQSMAVRRLTPVECERLQGFPDGYTDIKLKGKPTPDGPRYKALGNSMAVPVMRWIGQRIEAVDRIK
jgi:DNA (cytosine-5)-methyltransferase 1